LQRNFDRKMDEAVETIKSSPGSAGHFLNLGSSLVAELR